MLFRPFRLSRGTAFSSKVRIHGSRYARSRRPQQKKLFVKEWPGFVQTALFPSYIADKPVWKSTTITHLHFLVGTSALFPAQPENKGCGRLEIMELMVYTRCPCIRN